MNQASNASTALMVAVSTGHQENVEALLTQNIEINHRDTSGMTALLLAVRKGDYNIVELLLKHGADVNSTMKYGYTPLMVAIKKNDECMVQLLLKYRANIYARCDAGKNALYRAVRQQCTPLVCLLLKEGIGIDVVMRDGERVFLHGGGDAQSIALCQSAFIFDLFAKLFLSDKYLYKASKKCQGHMHLSDVRVEKHHMETWGNLLSNETKPSKFVFVALRTFFFERVYAYVMQNESEQMTVQAYLRFYDVLDAWLAKHLISKRQYNCCTTFFKRAQLEYLLSQMDI